MFCLKTSDRYATVAFKCSTFFQTERTKRQRIRAARDRFRVDNNTRKHVARILPTDDAEYTFRNESVVKKKNSPPPSLATV